ncbi:flagellar assembly protein FliH [Virgibacillus litoralis]|uniref:Flagellar assembly protein FliH n=1 Tax=Virgibacillus litoralis TaxID=578221 RepID=A0ABS4HE38_9BACI|nr:flagellar assembly protein FliH [Virgibacillus litoralis]MBP1949123.1 flagellar assembly protein FliH [Virgibacillus litoralis]
MSNIFSNQSRIMKEKLIKVKPIELNNQDSVHASASLEDDRKSIQSEIDLAHDSLKQIQEQQAILVQQTNAEIEKAKENWEIEREKYIKQAQDEGYKKGFELGKQEGQDQYKELLTNANKIVESATKDYHSTIDQSDETILELAIHVAEKIIKKELNENPESFIQIVNTAIKEIKDQSELSIYLHPNNYELVMKQKDEIVQLVDKDLNVSFYINDQLKEDSCLIEHPFGRIDASIDVQLQELREVLYEVNMESDE